MDVLHRETKRCAILFKHRSVQDGSGGLRSYLTRDRCSSMSKLLFLRRTASGDTSKPKVYRRLDIDVGHRYDQPPRGVSCFEFGIENEIERFTVSSAITGVTFGMKR